MGSHIKKQLEKEGYVFLEKYSPRLSALDASLEIGEVALLPDIKPSQQLSPKLLSDSDPNTYSGNFGLGRFPLHSDLAHWFKPPRYLLLRCLIGSASVATNVVDSVDIISQFGELALSRTLVHPRRPTANMNFMLTLLEKTKEGKRLFRWDQIFIRPASQSSSAVFQSVFRMLESINYKEVLLDSPGDTLVIDNWRMLHGRSAIPQPVLSRHIERVYMKEIN